MPPLRAARGTVGVAFFLAGFLFGALFARMPEVRDHAGLSNPQLGLALSVGAIGSVVSLPLSGMAVARFGSRTITRLGLAGICMATVLPALATSLLQLAAAVLVAGITHSALDVAMNAHGVAVEKRYRRPILSGFHALFSLGALAGSAVAALSAALGMSLTIQLLGVGGLSLLVVISRWQHFLPADEDATRNLPLLVKPPRRLWALGFIGFAGLLAEGAASDWSAIYMHDRLGASVSTAALGFTVFSVAMTTGRFVGDRLVSLLGTVRLVRIGGLLAAVGFGLALLIDLPAAAFVGFAALGWGLAVVVPVVFRAAGSTPHLPAGVGLGAVASMGYMGFIAGPPLIGNLSGFIGLPWALGLIVVLALVISALAPATAPVTNPPPLQSGPPVP